MMLDYQESYEKWRNIRKGRNLTLHLID